MAPTAVLLHTELWMVFPATDFWACHPVAPVGVPTVTVVEAVPPSPKSHATEAIVPSLSVEPAASTLHCRLGQPAVKDVVGGLFSPLGPRG